VDDIVVAAEDQLENRILRALLYAGEDEPSAAAATRAMMHTSRFSIDSHGA
jgi:LDH2 family malate/lactate/ureidoglycolate dehydrogenase